MVDNTKNIYGLFPTPVVVSNYTCSEDERHFLNTLQIGETTEIDIYGQVSASTYILNEPAVGTLAAHILNEATFMARDILSWNVSGMQFTQSWVSIKNPGQYHVRHSHYNSVISGVYYFNDDNGVNQSDLIFHKNKNPGNEFGTLQVQYNPNASTQFSWETFNITPKKGLLVMFPSYLDHSVGINNSNISRKSLAFNLLPVGKLGSESGLTQVLFGGLR